MVTMIKDWTMVYLFGKPDGSEMNTRWGRVVVGRVTIDASQQLNPNQYICSDPISRSPGNFVHTHSGQHYTLFGDGQEVELPVTYLPQLQEHDCVESILDSIKKGHLSRPV